MIDTIDVRILILHNELFITWNEKDEKKKVGIFSIFSKTNLPKLELFQNLCFRIAVFAFCSSSIIVSM